MPPCSRSEPGATTTTCPPCSKTAPSRRALECATGASGVGVLTLPELLQRGRQHGTNVVRLFRHEGPKLGDDGARDCVRDLRLDATFGDDRGDKLGNGTEPHSFVSMTMRRAHQGADVGRQVLGELHPFVKRNAIREPAQHRVHRGLRRVTTGIASGVQKAAQRG